MSGLNFDPTTVALVGLGKIAWEYDFNKSSDNYVVTHARAVSKSLSWQPGSRTILGNEELKLVANVYINALQAGDAPTKAVQEWAISSRPTASRWIKQARTLGLIGTPTKPGLPGNNTRKGPLPKEK